MAKKGAFREMCRENLTDVADDLCDYLEERIESILDELEPITGISEIESVRNMLKDLLDEVW